MTSGSAASVAGKSRLRKQGGIRKLLFLVALIALPFEAQGWDVAGLSLSVSYLGVVAFSLICFLSFNPWRLDGFDLVFLVFLSIAGVSLVVNVALGRATSLTHLGSGLRYEARGIVHLLRFVTFYVIYRAFKQFLSTGDWRHRQEVFCKGITTVAYGLAIYGSYQFLAQRFRWPLANINNLHHAGSYLSVHYFEQLRGSLYVIFATFGEPKTYAGFLLGMVPLLIGMLVIANSGRTVLRVGPSPKRLRLLITVLNVHFLLTFSRTGYVALALVVLFVSLFFSRKAAFAAGGVLLIFLLFLSTIMGQSLTMVWSQFVASLWNPQGTVAANVLRWQAALRRFWESPLLGLGLGNEFAPITIEFTARKVWLGAPGVWGYLLPSVGILGSMAFLFFLARHVWVSFLSLGRLEVSRGLRVLLFASLVGMIGVWTKQSIQFSMNSPWPWILLAANAALNRIAWSVSDTVDHPSARCPRPGGRADRDGGDDPT